MSPENVKDSHLHNSWFTYGSCLRRATEYGGEMRLSQPRLIRSNPITNQHWLRAPSAIVNNSLSFLIQSSKHCSKQREQSELSSWMDECAL